MTGSETETVTEDSATGATLLRKLQATGMGFWARHPILASLAFVALLTGLFIATTPGNRSEADDAFWFADEVETASWRGLPNPNHFVYLPLMRLLYLSANAFGFTVRSYPVMVAAGALLAALAVVTFVLFMHSRVGTSTSVSILTGIGLAVSYGFWRYSGEAEVYALASLVVLVALYVGLNPDLSTASALGAAALGAVAILAHILNFIPVLVVVPIVLFLRKQFRVLLTYTLSAIVFALTTAYGAYLYIEPRGQSFVATYTQADSGLPTLTDILEGFVTVGQNLVASQFLLGLEPVREILVERFPTKQLAEELYVGEHTGSVLVTLGMITLALLVITATATLIYRWRAGRTSKGSVVVWAIGIWPLAYFVGVAAYVPADPEAWILILTPIWLLVGALVLQPIWDRGWRLPVLLLASALLLHNYVGGLAVMRDPELDYNRVKSQWLVDNASASDVVVTAEGPVFGRYLIYHTDATVHELQDSSLEMINQVFSELGGSDGREFITSDVFDPPTRMQAGFPDRYALVVTYSSDLVTSVHPVDVSDVGSVFEVSD